MSFPPPDAHDAAMDEFDEIANHPDAGDEEPAPACTVCKRALTDTFYRVNNFVACESCRDLIDGVARSGSGIGRFSKAAILGSLASVAAATAFFWFTRYLHLGLAIFALPVGLFVAAAVRKGTGGRGGWVYQVMAVLLIYASIGMTFTAVAIGQAADLGQFNLEDDEEDPAAPAPAPAPDQPAPVAAPGQPPAPNPGANPPPPADLSVLLGLLAQLGAGLAAMIAIMPVMIAKETPALGLCTFLAIVSAWKMNRRERIAITGPFPTDELDHAPDHAGPTPALA